MEVWAIVLAAGTGARFGQRKQFLFLGGSRLVDRVVSVAGATCDAVALVHPPGMLWDGAVVAAAVEGGPTRSSSVRAGLSVVPDDAAVIVVCDAAHPLAPADLFRAVVDEVRAGADGAFPALPLAEAVKRVRDGRAVESLPREGLVAVQTPYALRADLLRAAHSGHPEAFDDTVLAEAIGARLTAVPGDPRNIHVVTLDDLRLAECLLPTDRDVAG